MCSAMKAIDEDASDLHPPVAISASLNCVFWNLAIGPAEGGALLRVLESVSCRITSIGGLRADGAHQALPAAAFSIR